MAKSNRASASTVRKELTAHRKGWGWSPSDIIAILRGGGTSLKGGEYERELCKELSMWWTYNSRDDVFWRTSGSGARAKVRGRQGRATAGQHGDIGATDPIGAPLIDMFTIEIKRGYSEYTLQDILDRPPGGGMQEWERWFAQALESWEQAGSYSWMLITRRDRRVPLVWLPRHVIHDLRAEGAFYDSQPLPYIALKMQVRNDAKVGLPVDAVGMGLDAFLAGVSPDIIRELATRI